MDAVDPSQYGPELTKIAKGLAYDRLILEGQPGTDDQIESLWRDFIEDAREIVRANRRNG